MNLVQNFIYEFSPSSVRLEFLFSLDTTWHYHNMRGQENNSTTKVSLRAIEELPLFYVFQSGHNKHQQLVFYIRFRCYIFCTVLKIIKIVKNDRWVN